MDRVWTIPNALSVARLLGVPVFLWLVLGPKEDGWALALLAFAGISDWLDGKIARALDQTSRLGQVLDPSADRLYTFATLIALVLRDIVPWWVAALLIGRDVLVVLALPVLRMYGYGPLPVNFAGKAATLCLLYAFPLLFLGDHHGIWAQAAYVTGWAFAIWGTGLYWWAGALYAVQARRLIAGARSTPPADDPTRRPSPSTAPERRATAAKDRKGATSQQ
ncbi:MAG: CDP-alcohol phosphatidyltransferase family protein [Streptosporangiales bacterium]|nr:CDP-alcohol phosphatidyltransferase family protein [Streptosporangiales bacterium]